MISRQDLIPGFQPNTMEKTIEGRVLRCIQNAGENGITQKVLINRTRGSKIWKEIAEATANLLDAGHITATATKRDSLKGSDYVFFFVK